MLDINQSNFDDCPLSEQFMVLSTQADFLGQFSEISRDCDRMPCFNFGTGARCIPVLPPHWSTHRKGSQKNFCNQLAERFSPKILAHSARVVTHCREFPNDCWETFCRHPESIPYILDCGPIVAGHDCPLSEQLIVLSTQAHLSRQLSEVSHGCFTAECLVDLFARTETPSAKNHLMAGRESGFQALQVASKKIKEETFRF